MGDLNCRWSSLKTKINEVLTQQIRGHYGKSVGIMTESGVIPDLESLDSFFSAPNSYIKGSAFMIMVVSSFEECKHSEF
jgi:cytochrome c2